MLEGARRLDEQPEDGCDICGAQSFVLYDGDKMCAECGHVPTPSGTRYVTTPAQEWSSWFEHRREEYEGWYGPERIRFPGGFHAPYFDN